MNETQLEDRMHEALLDEPPLGFDPDEVVDRAVRLQRRRRLTLATAGAAAGVLVLAAAAVVATGARSHEDQVGTQPGSVCQGPPPGATGQLTVVPFPLPTPISSL